MGMTRRILVGAVLMIALVGGALPNVHAQAAAKAPSLYTQLGGYDALAAVTDDFITRLATDPTLAKFFTN